MPDWMNLFFQTGDVILNLLWSAIGIGTVAVLIFFIRTQMQYNNSITIRQIVQGRERVIEDKARLYKDKSGCYWWMLKKERDKEQKLLPLPPESALDITNKGKFHAECWRYPSGHIEWIESDHTTGKLDWEEVSDKAGKKDVQLKRKSFFPINNNDRAVLVNQVMKAEVNRRKTWKEMVIPLAYIVATLLIIMGHLVFAENMYAPAIEAKKITSTQLTLMDEISQRLERMEYDIQEIQGGSPDAPD